MKFLNPMTKEEMLYTINTLSLTMIYNGAIRFKHVAANSSTIDNLAEALVAVVKQSVAIKDARDLSLMEIDPDQLVRKVEKNGTVLGVIQGGRG